MNALNALKRSHERVAPNPITLSPPFRGERVRAIGSSGSAHHPEEKETSVEKRQIIPQPYPLFLATAVEGRNTLIVRRVIGWQATAGSIHGDDLVPLVATRGKLTASVVPDQAGLLHHYSDSAHEAKDGLSKLIESTERHQ